MPAERVPFAEGLRLSPVPPGTTLLVVGEGAEVGREYCLRLLGGGPEEGAIVVATSPDARRVLARCELADGRFDLSRLPFVTGVDGPQSGGQPTRVLAVGDDADPTTTAPRLRALREDLVREGVGRVRTGVVSLTPLVGGDGAASAGRLVDVVADQVGDHGGLGVFHLDADTVEPSVVESLAERCHGRVDVRDGEEGPEVRISGLSGQPGGWLSAPLRP